MSTDTTSPATSGAPDTPGSAQTSSHTASGALKHRSRWSAFASALSFRNASAIWVLVIIMIVFSTTIPELFLTQRTWSTMLDTQVVAALTAVALVIPLAAGVFNIAIGAQVGAASMMCAWLLVPMGLPIGVSVILTVLASAAIGLILGVIIVRFRIDSFIASMGMTSLIAALVTILSGGRQILDIPRPLVDFASTQVFGVTTAFIIMILISFVIWYLLERTPLGRKVYAVGGNIEAARLSAVPTGKIIIGSLAVSGAVAGVAGVLLVARLGSGDPTVGPGYMIPAFTAAFLGSTQFRRGRFNVWGTVLSVYVLAIGIKGLQLAGAPTWVSDVFNGLALLVAVGLAVSVSGLGKSRWAKWRARKQAARAA